MDIDDDYIISFFIRDNGTFISSKISSIKTSRLDIKLYLDNRYADSFSSYTEIVYRILHHIDNKPVCLTCGKPVEFFKFKYGYKKYCCRKCIKKSEETINKAKQTCLMRYGVDNPLKCEKFKEKAKLTCMSKYGVEYSSLSEEVKKKVKKTVLEKFGVENVFQNDDIKEKVKNTFLEKFGTESIMSSDYFKNKKAGTFLEKYGDICASKTDIVKNKIKETCFEKYGCSSYLGSKECKAKSRLFFLDNFGVTTNSQIPENRKKISEFMSRKDVQDHINNIKKMNNSFNSSKIEKKFKLYLEQTFPNDFECQYRSEQYPFNCDFYIKSLELYVEIQANWTHGFHPFNINDENDICILNKWTSKNTDFYNNAIKTWTCRDVEKRKVAKINNLNYLEIFSNDLNTCIQKLNEFINGINNRL